MQVHLGIDVGKTNLRVGVFSPDLQLIDRWSVPTADVALAQAALSDWLFAMPSRYRVRSTGISIFGPLQVDPSKADYGAVIESSEPAWSGVNIPTQVAQILERGVYFDFDVSAGALAEATMGSGKGKSAFVYLSVGTGIGAVYFRGSHRPGYAPQMGHMYIPRELEDLGFEGSCRFHGACLQGLASGKALALRWGLPAEELEWNHPAWDLEARYIARACTNLIYSFSPEAIVLGSSVGSVPSLVPKVNHYLLSMLNNFLEPELRTLYSEQPPVAGASLGPESSLIGAALLGMRSSGLQIRTEPNEVSLDNVERGLQAVPQGENEGIIFVGVLTKPLVMALPDGAFILSNVSKGDGSPVLAGAVGDQSLRGGLWDKLRASRLSGRRFYVFANEESLKHHLARRAKALERQRA